MLMIHGHTNLKLIVGVFKDTLPHAEYIADEEWQWCGKKAHQCLNIVHLLYTQHLFYVFFYTPFALWSISNFHHFIINILSVLV